MAAALRVLRRRPAASPGRLLPSSLPGLSPKLRAAAAASSLQYMPGARSSPILVPSVIRRYCSSRGRCGTANLASVRRTDVSPIWGAALSGVPAIRRASPLSLFVPRRACSSEKQPIYMFTSTELAKSLVEPMKVDEVLELVQDMEKTLRRRTWVQRIHIVLLAAVMYQLYWMLDQLKSKVSALEEKVAKLESDQPFFSFLREKSDQA